MTHALRFAMRGREFSYNNNNQQPTQTDMCTWSPVAQRLGLPCVDERVLCSEQQQAVLYQQHGPAGIGVWTSVGMQLCGGRGDEPLCNSHTALRV